MRLIDADALKEQLEPFRYSICGFEGVLALIDNAPTVPLPDFKGGYKQAILDGKTQYQKGGAK